MTETLRKRCELFVSNHNAIRTGFRWDSAYIYPLCANIYTEKYKCVDVDRLKDCLNLLKQKTKLFSNFRGISRLAIATFLAVSEQPEKKLDQSLQVHGLLKEHFWDSQYLPVAALILEGMASPGEYEQIARRTREIYNLMKSEHPFLTSGEDSTLAVLLALSDKSNDQLVNEMEQCYQQLKSSFFLGNSVQSLSHVLALGEGSADLKCRKVTALLEALKNNGHKYGTNYELPTLGVLALLNAEAKILADDMAAVDAYLKTQKGFGTFGIGAKQRLMYAGMLVTDDYIESASEPAMKTAAMNSAISIVIAQQAAMCASIAAASAAAASASSS